jgi:5-methylcytosine-specific restriction endonuclease McrA
MSQEEYIANLYTVRSKDDYAEIEEKRKNDQWSKLIKSQDFKCYYCSTDIRLIQQLIINRFIGLRKRGLKGYSGLHLELDHKNANKNDNSIENLVAACYYCNNDKSNTISDTIFLQYFGPKRKLSFQTLHKDFGMNKIEWFSHHFKK